MCASLTSFGNRRGRDFGDDVVDGGGVRSNGAGDGQIADGSISHPLGRCRGVLGVGAEFGSSEEHSVTLEYPPLVREIDGRGFSYDKGYVAPDVEFGPVAQRKDT